MADSDLDNEPGEESGINNKASKGSSRVGGKSSFLTGGSLKILLAFPAAGIISALAVWFFVMRQSPVPPPASVRPAAARESVRAELTVEDAAGIAASRSEMRRGIRSSQNQAFTRRMDEKDLLQISIRGELALLAGMFTHYMSTTGKFYELFRIMANDYVDQREQVLEIFEKELLPEYTVTERRRRAMRRRVEHDPAVELYDRLDYIAYHDSIAVYSFREFITLGGADKFASTSDLISESKFMIEDYRQQLQDRMRDYDLNIDIPEKTWDKYFGSWPW